MHSLNQPAARVWRACDGLSDPEALAAACEIDRDTVTLALKRLQDVELLDPEPDSPPPPAEEGLSRRAALRGAVLAGASLGVALPVIRSITAPSIAMAASGRSGNQVKGKAGCPCTKSSQCSQTRSISSFCNTGVGSCQRSDLASRSHTSSCYHVGSYAEVCRSSDHLCGSCKNDGQCPTSHPTCTTSHLCR